MGSTALEKGAASGAAGAGPRRALTFGLCMAVVAVAFEAISVATAMPSAARELDGLDLYAWVFSVFLIGQLFATVAAGRLCDRIGVARPMVGGVVLFAVGLAVSGTAATMEQLIAGRLVQGLGSGVVSVGMYVVIAQVYDERRRPRMFSYISSAWIVPSFVGPAVAAWLTHHLTWRAVFWAVLPLLAVGAALMLPPVIRAARSPGPKDPTAAPAAALWAAGLAALGAAGVQFAGQRLTPVGLLVGAVGVGLVGISLPQLMPPGFFRFGPGLAPVITVRTLIAGAFFGAEAFVPLMLVEQRHLSLLVAGSTLTVGAVGWGVGAWLQSLRRLPLRRDRVISLGAGCVLIGITLVALVGWRQWWVGVVVVAWVFAGVGMGLATSSTSVATMTLSGAGEQGRNASSLQFGEAFGAGFFVGVGGTIFATTRPTGDLTMTFGSVLTAMAAVAVLALLTSLRIGPISASAPPE